MIRLLTFLASFALILFSEVYAAEAKDDGALGEVAAQQLDAFRKNNFAAAYDFAHSGIKAQFTQAEFEKMVRAGFGAMLKPGEAKFGRELIDGDGGSVDLTLSGKDGEVSAYRYLLEKENGVWRITAVVPIEVEPAETLV